MSTRNPSPFVFLSRLQWRLTLSYAAVTAGTVIVLAAVSVAIALAADSLSTDRTYSSFYWSKTAFQDNVPFMIDETATLQTWLDRVRREGFTWNDFQVQPTSANIDDANTLVLDAPIYVLDPDLQLIAASPSTDRSWLGQPFDARAMLGFGIEDVLAAAQTGDKGYYSQSTLQPDGSYIVAFPLRATDEDPVVAIAIYRVKPLAIAAPTNLSLYTTFFCLVAVIMFGIALPVGAIFGWIVSRGWRRRLSALSSAAQAWSRGDFSSQPRDRSGDEIGDLSRTLGQMADQLETLIHARDELARVEERNRLARDLHDTVKQQTYAARMQLSAARNLIQTDPAAAATHLESALQLNRDTQQELKLIIDELRPAALQGKGLAQALEEYATRWQGHTGIRATLLVNGSRALPLDVEQTLYRVVQEALSNVARHSDADTVELALDLTADRARLIVADNGCGFEPSAVAPGSLGLNGMRQRLAEIGGTLTVETRLSAGTRVIAQVESVTR